MMKVLRISQPFLFSVWLLFLTATITPTAANLFGLQGDDDDDDDDEVDQQQHVAFQGQNAGEHYTMKVEAGHQFQCFEDKLELMTAVHQYEGHNVVDMTLAEKYGWPIGNWCLSHQITDLSDVFADNHWFNEDIGKWDTSKVTDMTAMFQNAMEFNQDLSLWDTSKVTSMSRMFAMAKSFNSDISQWDTSQLQSTSYMFLHALQFNQDISHWKLPQIQDMERMFRDARSFTYRAEVEMEWNMQDKHQDQSINTHRMLSDCEF